jgi:hypothetical protein
MRINWPMRKIGSWCSSPCCLVDYRTHPTASRWRCRARSFSAGQPQSSVTGWRGMTTLPSRDCRAEVAGQQLPEEPHKAVAIYGRQRRPLVGDRAVAQRRGGGHGSTEAPVLVNPTCRTAPFMFVNRVHYNLLKFQHSVQACDVSLYFTSMSWSVPMPGGLFLSRPPSSQAYSVR